MGLPGRALEPATVPSSLPTPVALALSGKALTMEIQQLPGMIDDTASHIHHEKISLESSFSVPPLQQVMAFCAIHHGSGEKIIFPPAHAYLLVLVEHCYGPTYFSLLTWNRPS